ncbi:hypothetical protein IJI76_01580 [Candidatus Saccharibacteria bacterium]|nr:hypothetical protein [Candidatus Saccharibacteria bacterium]
MNKSRKKSKKDGGISFGVIFFILAFAAGITFLILSLIIPKKSNTDDTLSTAINENTTKTNNNIDNPDDAAKSKTPSQYDDTGMKKTDPNSMNMSITKNEVVDGKYQVRVTIYEILTEPGTCELEMKSANGDYIKRSAKVINAGPDSTSCEGFDIKTEGISSGAYSFTITVTSGKHTGKVDGTIKI